MTDVPSSLGALCDPCTGDTSCRDGAWCVVLSDGTFCGQACTDASCPAGFSCSTVRRGAVTSLQCVPETGGCLGCVDSDDDTVCDESDICPGEDDRNDRDGDRLPDACDPCPDETTGDTDGDGVCDSMDVCPGGDDTLDADADAVPDACDRCATWPDDVIVRDPGFVDPSAWTASSPTYASVLPEGPGHSAPGEGQVQACLGSPESLTGRGCAPASVAPLGMRVSASYVCGASSCVGRLILGDGFETRAFYTSYSSESEWIDYTLCLGERAASGPITPRVEVGGGFFPSCAGLVSFDDVAIVPAPDCPAVGTVTNGDFEGPAGWDPMRVVVAETGGHAAYLFDGPGCESGNVSMLGELSIPLATTLPNAALQYRARGHLQEGGVLLGDLDTAGTITRIIDTASLPATEATQRTCLPAGSLGTISRLELRFNDNDCGRTMALEAWLDDFTIVSDPALCP
jgi:hypothetical protein